MQSPNGCPSKGFRFHRSVRTTRRPVRVDHHGAAEPQHHLLGSLHGNVFFNASNKTAQTGMYSRERDFFPSCSKISSACSNLNVGSSERQKYGFLPSKGDSMIYGNNTVLYSSQISFIYLSQLIIFLISIRVHRQSIHGRNNTENDYRSSYNPRKHCAPPVNHTNVAC
jgi:hypothetical protein